MNFNNKSSSKTSSMPVLALIALLLYFLIFTSSVVEVGVIYPAAPVTISNRVRVVVVAPV